MLYPTDEIDYINRTIQTIQNLADPVVLALAIYPFYYESGWKYAVDHSKKMCENQLDKLKKNYKEIFGLNSYVIANEKDMVDLTDTIIEYFSGEGHQ